MKKQQQIRPWLGAWILGLMMVTPGSAQEAPRDREVPTRTYTTRYVGDAPPSVDGRLDDAAWTQVPWSGDYIEWSPEENTPPTEQTKLKIVYDMNNLYVAFRCYDRDPAGIVRRLSRRDVFDGDWVEINIDSNRDLRTAFSFTITAAGVQGEEFITDNGNVWDPTWNPIWYAKTQVDEEGWTAEIRIPFSQLRFGDAPAQVWGIQSTRRYFRNEERSLWQRTPLDAPGWVSEFGELHGLTNLRPQRHWEVQPYTVSSLDRYAAEPGNPFRDGRDAQLGVGLDAKIGLTSDLMLDLTINPDFGQVEADPSAIALDGFQIFFPEQRPFFIESKDIFDYKFSASQAANTFGFDNLFYSRRIGRAPQGYPAAPVGAFVQQPDLTTILGAAKFSGKTADGWSIGVLNSTTAAEEARIDTPDGRLTERVEPLTNYVVGRVQKDLNNRNTFVGGLVTATHRQLTEGLGFLHEAAYTGGVDAKHQWKNRTWYLGGNVVWSHVQGSPEAITATQRAQRRLFQRVDAQHVAVDTARTSLTGLGGHVQVGKAAGRWRFESGVTWRSPELELNDVGFQLRADDLRPYAWVGYRTIKPLQRVRRYAVNYQHLAAFDFAGALNEVTLNVNGWVNLNSNWWINGGVTYTPVQYSTFALRGGPRLRQAPSVSYRQGVISDSRRALRLTVNHSGAWGAEQAFRTHEVSGTLTYQPTNALQVSVTPTYTYNYDQLQFVANVDVGDAVRYLNATLDQQTVSLPLRIDYILRPNLSLQYWGQPFISRGRYRRFKHITDATARRLDDRYTAYTDDQLALADGVYGLDEDRDGVAEARFGRPDFAFVQWRSNLVVRWEYRAGSELFLVWSQDLAQLGEVEDSLYDGLRQTLRGRELQHIFLVKATYRFMR